MSLNSRPPSTLAWSWFKIAFFGSWISDDNFKILMFGSKWPDWSSAIIITRNSHILDPGFGHPFYQALKQGYHIGLQIFLPVLNSRLKWYYQSNDFINRCSLAVHSVKNIVWLTCSITATFWWLAWAYLYLRIERKAMQKLHLEEKIEFALLKWEKNIFWCLDYLIPAFIVFV